MPSSGKCRVGPIEARNSRGIQGFLTTRLGIFQAIFPRRFRIAETGNSSHTGTSPEGASILSSRTFLSSGTAASVSAGTTFVSVTSFETAVTFGGALTGPVRRV